MSEYPKAVAIECSNCRYCIFDRPEQDLKYGKCHRYPPQAGCSSHGSSSDYPRVYKHSFCGEFKILKFEE